MAGTDLKPPTRYPSREDWHRAVKDATAYIRQVLRAETPLIADEILNQPPTAEQLFSDDDLARIRKIIETEPTAAGTWKTTTDK